MALSMAAAAAPPPSASEAPAAPAAPATSVPVASAAPLAEAAAASSGAGAGEALMQRQQLPMPAALPAPADTRVMTEEQLTQFAEQIKQFSEISRHSIQRQKVTMDAERQRRSHKAGFRGATAADRPPGATRPRWKPTPVQISILEYIFENSDLLPGDKDITIITDGLRLYGPVEEVNVFYWFQNRRARAKRTANQELPKPLT